MSMPPDPFSDLAGLAATHHEIFESYLKAGFCRSDALYLLGQWVQAGVLAANMPGVPPPEVPPE